MGTNVPQPTFGPLGFQAPTDAQILAGVQADLNADFGGDLVFTTTSGSAVNPTPQGQIATSLTAIISAVYATFINITNQVNPAFAQGRMQDAIGNIYFIQRNPAQPTIVQCLCSGLTGTVIPGGSVVGPSGPAIVVDTAGNQYTCTQGGTIPLSGSITLPFANLAPGPIACPSNTVTSIFQTIPGWDSVNNLSDGVLGNDTESRSQFEERRAATVEGNSFGPVGAIIGAVANVSGVLDYYGYSNNTSSPVTVAGVTIAANAIYICVEGGAQSDIAQAILSKLNPGPPMIGNTTVTAFDNNPLYVSPIPYTIIYETPSDLSVLFAVNIKNSATVPANAVTLIQNAIINAFAGGDGGLRARIGSEIFASRFYSTVASLGPWAQIISIQIGSNNNPDAIFAATITTTTLTVISTTSGGVLVGGTLSDSRGLVPEGTTIVSGSGPYVISNSITIGDATFTASAGSPSTHLVVTSVTGTIHIGDTVAGTGITAGTTVLSQLSGTTGGAGTYILSAANTASSASCTAYDTFTTASPTLNDLQVQANQVPVTDANLIAVTLS